MEYIALALALASLVLHFIAPRTKTTADDKAAEYVDKVRDVIDASHK